MTSPNLASSAVALQWSLNETANSGFSIAKGVLRAATTDDVQPIAIMAAEAFGATLAMCQETQMKVEIAAKQSHTRFVRFLKSSIGYSKDDSAYHLASSSAGVRFLGLAAALLCVGDHFQAAQSLEMMIRSSAGADQLLPTVRQLKELLLALEYKLNRVGFADSILGWGTFLTNHPLVDLVFKERLEQAENSPSSEFLEKLVDALRGIGRLGDVSQLRIKTGSDCHWVVAFIKWCVGEPPMIILEDGSVLVDQENPRVTLLITKAESGGQVEIEVFHDLGRPSQLWSSTRTKDSVDESRPWRGMVTIEHAYESRLANINYPNDHGILYKAVCCLVNTATYAARNPWMDHTRYRNNPQPGPGRVEVPHESSRPSFRSISLYPDDASLNSSLARLPQSFKADVDICLVPKLEPNQALRQLTFVSEYIKKLSCRCPKCNGFGNEPSSLVHCRVDWFERLITDIATWVIVYALFDCTEPMFVFGPLQFTTISTSLLRDLYTYGEWPYFQGETLLRDALVMIGGRRDAGPKIGIDAPPWIAGEVRGQVAYLAAFDTMQIREDGVFCLGGGPGKILYEGRSSDYVLGSDGTGTRITERFLNNPVRKIMNYCQRMKLNWHVTEMDTFLLLSWNIKDKDTVGSGRLRYLLVLNGSIVVSNCPHPETSALSQADDRCFYIEPTDFLSWSDEGKIQIVPVSGDDELRLFSFFTVGQACVVRGHGVCLACCLETCREFDLQYLIL